MSQICRHEPAKFALAKAMVLSRQHRPEPCLITQVASDPAHANLWRTALRQTGVPVLELNAATSVGAEPWLEAAREFSAEFLVPVVIFTHGLVDHAAVPMVTAEEAIASVHEQVKDPQWLQTRRVALTQAVETSTLNQEFRRTRDRKGWIRIGWQAEAALTEGNGLLLAWSSPLPLRRIRDFAARCPELMLIAPDAEAIAAAVAEQGISVNGWRFAVK